MFKSLQKLSGLPDDTTVRFFLIVLVACFVGHCAHLGQDPQGWCEQCVEDHQEHVGVWEPDVEDEIHKTIFVCRGL